MNRIERRLQSIAHEHGFEYSGSMTLAEYCLALEYRKDSLAPPAGGCPVPCRHAFCALIVGREG
jgi:hypothetical protein